MSAALILVAAGRSSRAGIDKLWADLGGKPVIAYSIETASAAAFFDRVVVVAPKSRWEAIRLLGTACALTVTLAEGGERRQDSVARGLAECQDISYVCVHDAARPLASAELMRKVLDAAYKFDAATAGISVVDTIKRVEEQTVAETLNRASLIAVQTPQAFSTSLLREAHELAARQGIEADDDAALVEHAGARVYVVEGERHNIKLTSAEDLAVLDALGAQL